MKKTTLATAALIFALAVSPGAANAKSSPGQPGQPGTSGSSRSSGSSNGSNGSSGTSNANCAGAISIVFSWFGFPAGTNTQCQHS